MNRFYMIGTYVMKELNNYFTSIRFKYPFKKICIITFSSPFPIILLIGMQPALHIYKNSSTLQMKYLKSSCCNFNEWLRCSMPCPFCLLETKVQSGLKNRQIMSSLNMGRQYDNNSKLSSLLLFKVGVLLI